ncbi:MAG TPA: hypothetical protein VJJ20_03205 [Candidatus Paceibacterota bacterium]
MSKRTLWAVIIILGLLALVDATHATNLLPQWLDDALGGGILYFVFYLFPLALAIGVGILIWEFMKKRQK